MSEHQYPMSDAGHSPGGGAAGGGYATGAGMGAAPGGGPSAPQPGAAMGQNAAPGQGAAMGGQNAAGGYGMDPALPAGGWQAMAGHPAGAAMGYPGAGAVPPPYPHPGHGAAPQPFGYAPQQAHAGAVPGHAGGAPGHGGGAGMAEVMEEIARGNGLSGLGKMLNFDDRDFWKGALIGAAAVLLLTNETVQGTLFKTGVKAKDAVKSGVDKVKGKASGEQGDD